MTTLDKINSEIISIMKERSKDPFVMLRKALLKIMKSELQNNLKIDEPKSEDDTLFALHKGLSKGLVEFKDKIILDTLKRELKIIEEFLPKELFPKALTEEELDVLVDKHLSLGNFGDVMKAVRAEVVGPFDGKFVSSLIKSKLS